MKLFGLIFIPLNIVMIFYLLYPIINIEVRKKALLRSIVQISDDKIYGSGGVIQHKGSRYILSNSHVCRKNKYKMITYDGAPVDELQVLRQDPGRDLCLLTAPQEGLYGLKALRLGVGYQLGDRILSGGYSTDQGPIVMEGLLIYYDNMHILSDILAPGQKCPAGLDPDLFTPFLCYWNSHVIISNMISVPGQSGSPVVNMDGDLIAVVVASSGGLSALIPLETVREFLEDDSALDNGPDLLPKTGGNVATQVSE